MAKHTVYFHWPYTKPPEPYDLEQAWATWMRMKEGLGFKLEKVYRVWRTPEVVINDKGDLVQEYNMEIELTRAPVHHIFDIPDELVPAVLKNVPGAKLIE